MLSLLLSLPDFSALTTTKLLSLLALDPPMGLKAPGGRASSRGKQEQTKRKQEQGSESKTL